MTFFKLIRYKNLIMVLLTMVLVKYCMIASVLDNPNLSDLEFIIYALSVLLITAGGYIINDIYDIDIDKINKPKKTFVGNSISIKNAWTLYAVLSIGGMGLAIYISIIKSLPEYILLFLFGYACLFFYSRYFQKKPLIGNIIIAFICGALIYLTYLFDFRLDYDQFYEKIISEKLSKAPSRISEIKFFIAFSFLGTLIREIIKDIEDIDGDYNAGYQTLPIVLGKRRARDVSIFMSILFIILLILNTVYFYSMGYLLVTIAMSMICGLTLYMLYELWTAKTKKHFHFLSNLMKMILFFGILSMILFTFD